MFGGVLAVGIVGSLLSRFKPLGMSRAMLATAIAQLIVSVIALVMGHFTLIINGFFIALWLVPARLFQNAAAEESSSNDQPTTT